MQRAAITLTFTADLDRVPGWGDKPSDWVDLINQRLLASDTYSPEITVHEIGVKRYDYVEGQGYVRPAFNTMVDQLLEIKTILVSVNSDSDPDAMGNALDRMNALVSDHA